LADTHRLVGALVDSWKCQDLELAYGKSLTAAAPAVPEVSGADDRVRDLAEQYVALCVPFFLAPFFERLRTLSAMLAILAGSLVLAATGYSFQPEKLIVYIATGLTILVAAFLVWVLYRINRNELVSRISRTKFNSFTPDGAFLSSLMTVVVPLLILTGTQLSGRFRVIAEPVLDILR